MKLLLSFALLLISLFCQSQITTYEVLDSNNAVLTSYQKVISNDSATCFYRFNYIEKWVTRINVIERQLSENSKCISKSYSSYSFDSLGICKSRNEFMKAAVSDASSIYEMEWWDFFYRNDSLLKIELTESGRFTQRRIFEYQKGLCQVKYHSIREGLQKDFYAKDSILISKKGKRLKNYYLRWDEPIISNSWITKKSRRVFSDSIEYAKSDFYYNKWGLNEHLFAVCMAEGPIYSMFIELFEVQLERRKERPYLGDSYDIERTKKKGRLSDLVYKSDNEIIKKIRVTYN